MLGRVRLWVAAAGAAALAAPLLGQAQPAQTGTRLPDQQQAETLGYDADTTTRMTVPVSIGGEGPYRFVVDTGAERTVSQTLAHELDSPRPHRHRPFDERGQRIRPWCFRLRSGGARSTA